MQISFQNVKKKLTCLKVMEIWIQMPRLSTKKGQLEHTNLTLLPCSLFLPVYYQIHVVHVQIQQKNFGRCYSGFHHTRWITHCMAFPYPAADSLFPMDHLLSFDVSLTIPKNIRKMIYAAFSPITAYIRGYSLYSRVHRDVYIIQILLDCSLTWIRLIWLLAFHIPWDRSDSTLHCPSEAI